jgi:hypothetical protein
VQRSLLDAGAVVRNSNFHIGDGTQRRLFRKEEIAPCGADVLGNGLFINEGSLCASLSFESLPNSNPQR